MCGFGTKITFSERKTPILEQFGTESVPIKIEGIGAIQFPLIAGREKMDQTRAPIANVITHDRKRIGSRVSNPETHSSLRIPSSYDGLVTRLTWECHILPSLPILRQIYDDFPINLPIYVKFRLFS